MEKEKFLELLDQSYQWPDYYDFKFIIKSVEKDQILSKLSGFNIHETPSKNGTYVSITARKMIYHSHEVIAVYELMRGIKGLMTL